MGLAGVSLTTNPKSIQKTPLRSNFRSNDIVGRIGGDEFCIISPNLKEEDFKHIKEKIMNDCTKWTEENKSPYALSISMGYISYPDENIGFNLTQLLADADSSLYVEKRRKKAEKAQEEKNRRLFLKKRLLTKSTNTQVYQRILQDMRRTTYQTCPAQTASE